MIDELRAMAIFARTVETGSFRAAAKQLALSPSVVSHHISQLEQRLGVTLLYRTTRQLKLTEDGERLFAAAGQMISAAQQGLNDISAQSSEPSGQLRVSLPALLARSPIIKHLAEFAQLYPKVSLQLSFTDLQQDLLKEGIDLAIRVGNLQDSSLKSKRLFSMTRKLVVAPALAEKYAEAKQPEDLQIWDWIGLVMRADVKQLLSPAGQAYALSYQPRIVVDSLEAQLQLAIAGMGIITPPAFMAKQPLATGQLQELLPDWQVEPVVVYAIWPAQVRSDALALRLMRFLAESIGDVLDDEYV